MFLSYPLQKSASRRSGLKTIETGEIRVGKAMVDKKKQGDEAIDDKPRDKRRKGAQGLTVRPLGSS